MLTVFISAKGVGYVCRPVCLSSRLLKKLWTDFDEILEERGPVTKSSDFGCNLDHDADPGIF